MKTNWMIPGTVFLVGGVLLMLGGWGTPSVHAGKLAGLTPTPTPTPIPTPTPPPVERPELRVSKAAEPIQVLPGGAVVYTIVVENVGATAATGVTLTDDVPAQLQVLGAEVSQGTVAVTGNQVVAAVGVLGPGYVATLTISARLRADVAPGTQVENIVIAGSDQTGEVTAMAVITVPGLLPESGADWPGTALAGIALVVAGVGFLALGVRRRAKR